MTTTTCPAAPGTLRTIPERGEFVLAPGVYEMFGAKVADGMGFAALYMTGYGVSASRLGQPDAGLVGFTDVHGRARVIAQGTRKPIEVAVDSRGSRDLLVIARTDARTALGLDEAIARRKAFARAGAEKKYAQ